MSSKENFYQRDVVICLFVGWFWCVACGKVQWLSTQFSLGISNIRWICEPCSSHRRGKNIWKSLFYEKVLKLRNAFVTCDWIFKTYVINYLQLKNQGEFHCKWVRANDLYPKSLVVNFSVERRTLQQNIVCVKVATDRQLEKMKTVDWAKRINANADYCGKKEVSSNLIFWDILQSSI